MYIPYVLLNYQHKTAIGIDQYYWSILITAFYVLVTITRIYLHVL